MALLAQDVCAVLAPPQQPPPFGEICAARFATGNGDKRSHGRGSNNAFCLAPLLIPGEFSCTGVLH